MCDYIHISVLVLMKLCACVQYVRTYICTYHRHMDVAVERAHVCLCAWKHPHCIHPQTDNHKLK